MPRPCTLVTTPKPSFSRRSTAARAWRAPPPSHSSGRLALRQARRPVASSAAVDGVSAPTMRQRRQIGRHRRSARPGCRSESRRSPGRSARSARRARLRGSSAARSRRCARGTRPSTSTCSIDSWSGASWMYARSWSRYSRLDLAGDVQQRRAGGQRLDHAPAALPAAGAGAGERARPGRRRRAHRPSAMLQRAGFAARADDSGSLPRCAIASRIGMLWIEITPNAVLARRIARERRRSVRRRWFVLDMACNASRNIDVAAGRVRRQRRSQKKSAARLLRDARSGRAECVFLRASSAVQSSQLWPGLRAAPRNGGAIGPTRRGRSGCD